MSRPRRIDRALVAEGLAHDEVEARALIEDDRVTVNGAPVLNTARQVSVNDTLAVVPLRKFVSRGGLKLDAALEYFAGVDLPLRVAGRRVLDIGASTGGFVDCLLERGAMSVVACDVGHGLIHPRLAADPRVDVRDGVNARDLPALVQRGDFPAGFDLVVADVSFISLRMLLDGIKAVLFPGGEALLLVKPQFEATKAEVDRGGGVISDEAVRRRCIESVSRSLEEHGFRIRGEVDSAVPGPAGNREHWIRASIV